MTKSPIIDNDSRILRCPPSDWRWVAFLDSHSQANIFHHPGWMELLSQCYGFRPFILAVVDQASQVSAGIPVMEVHSRLSGARWVALPFTDHCAPLYSEYSQLEFLVHELARSYQERESPHIEVRWELPDHVAIQKYSNYVLHLLPLIPDADRMYQGFSRQQRQNVRQAEENGVSIEWADSLDGLRRFYDLHTLTRRRHGLPPQPWRFFELLHQRLMKNSLGFVLLARAGDRDLAAGVFLHWKQTLSYKYAASAEAGQRMRPNHLLTWVAIRWGCEHGFSTFDLGRSDVGDSGLRTFKHRWGAQEAPLGYSLLSASPPHRMDGNLTAMMSWVIQKSPKWVCRATGELFYRYFA